MGLLLAWNSLIILGCLASVREDLPVSASLGLEFYLSGDGNAIFFFCQMEALEIKLSCQFVYGKYFTDGTLSPPVEALFVPRQGR